MTTTSPRPSARTEPLLKKARLAVDSHSALPKKPADYNRRYRTARFVVISLLGRLTSDAFVIRENDDVSIYGPGDGIEATLTVLDPRAWWHLATEGSIGLGRGFIEGWWHSDDPDLVVRVAARNMRTLDEIRNRMANLTNPIVDRVRRFGPTPDRSRNREDIGAHYDLGNGFFQLFLDETMTYSSAVFERQDQALADASRAKYDRLLRKLGVSPGMS
ncbi:MAG: class I SAM-dependent methyltransferase, partial [Acidimicrobiia bacterium]|nr:class I SAM-dependent methyltransferase [Acidimicrobiia bacterium]